MQKLNQKDFNNINIAILVPCYNEEKTIDKVVFAFQKELPKATVYVYDNHSEDRTIEVARLAKATVYHERRKGKGNVVRRMFNDIEADIYVLVDGDNTYSAKEVHALIQKLLDENLDMVVGTRNPVVKSAYRLGHQFGNRFFNYALQLLFGSGFQDVFSGYRVFSRRFVKSFPCHSSGFEIETEISVHALEMNLAVAELETPYAQRPAGSFSKLNTYRDGLRILFTLIKLFKEVKPLHFFSILFLILSIASVILFVPLLITYFETGLVPRFPTAILVASLMILAFLSLFSGIILDSISRARLENKRLLYLMYKERTKER